MSNAKPEAAPPASSNSSLGMARTDTNDVIQIEAREVAQNDESELLYRKVAATANEEEAGEVDHHLIEIRRNRNNDVTTQQVMSAVNELVIEEMVTTIKTALDDVLRKILSNSQSGVQSIVYNFVWQVMLSLLRRDVIGKRLESHIAKSLHMDEAVRGLSKGLCTAISFLARTAIFVRRETDRAMVDKIFSETRAPKEPMSNLPTFEDDSQSPSSRSESGTAERPRKKSSNGRSKHVPNKRKIGCKTTFVPIEVAKKRTSTPGRNWSWKDTSVRRTSYISASVQYKTPRRTRPRDVQ